VVSNLACLWTGQSRRSADRDVARTSARLSFFGFVYSDRAVLKPGSSSHIADGGLKGRLPPGLAATLTADPSSFASLPTNRRITYC
jgi:hypothetical protein